MVIRCVHEPRHLKVYNFKQFPTMILFLFLLEPKWVVLDVIAREVFISVVESQVVFVTSGFGHCGDYLCS